MRKEETNKKINKKTNEKGNVSNVNKKMIEHDSKIEIEFNCSKDEYVKSRKLFLRKSGVISNSMIIFLTVMTLVEIMLIAVKEFFFAIVIGILLLISYSMMWLLYCYQPSKSYEKTEFIKKKMKFEINDKAIVLTLDDKEKMKLDWINITEIWESKEYIFLIQSKYSYTLILKRAIKNDYDLVRLQKMYAEQNKNAKYIDLEDKIKKQNKKMK